FDLGCGRLLRTTLVRLGDEEHLLLVTIHHIVSDGWSIGVLVHEFPLVYDAYRQGIHPLSPSGGTHPLSPSGGTHPLSPSGGTPPLLPELPVQYADFARWQRRWLSEEVLKNHLACWKEALAGAPLVLELPSDRPRPAIQTYRGNTCAVAIPHELTAALEALSRERGVTLFMTLLAAFDVLLCRYSGQEDLLIGTPIAGRDRVEIEGLVGFFAGTLVLRGDLRGNPRGGELLRRVRETALDAYAHQDLPFERLVEELQ
ncbi:MAG: hypothetical protein GY856_44675, partial [bacterium]|nr:hypothetical protein [bacterium]